jgi:hypothetical protein
MRNKVLHRVKEEGNIGQSLKRRKVKRIGHILCENRLVNTILKER